MRILLDENIPESVRRALQELGHHVDSVVSLGLTGLENGRLYREVAQGYQLFFTKTGDSWRRSERSISPPLQKSSL